MTTNPKSLSTLETLAARWGVSVRTLRRMVARGDLKTHRIGSQLRFSEEDVTAYEKLHRGLSVAYRSSGERSWLNAVGPESCYHPNWTPCPLLSSRDPD